jgi:OOP family OmpA-OmpF porin
MLSAGISLATVATATDAQALAPATLGDELTTTCEPSAGGSASASLGGESGGESAAESDASADNDPPPPAAAAPPAASTTQPKKTGWGVEDQDKKSLFRYAPERNMWELGLYGGAFFPHIKHDFYDPATAPQKSLWAAGPEFGLRAAYRPLSFRGVEAEFSAIPTFVRNAQSTFAFVYGFRGHALLQAPGTRIAPFILGGYGGMGVFSETSSAGLGNDLDAIGHLGVGVKVFLNRHMAVRLDARQYIGAKAAQQADHVSHYSLTAGITFTLGRAKRTIGDLDKDGFKDNVDVCPMAPGIAPDGCPPRDLDGDGLFDHEDRCPCDPGPAPSGCPTGKDRDKDGFVDEIDECPDEPGIAPSGCPVRDADDDGFPDDKDTCPLKPETVNGWEDGDGCPDKVPERIKEFEGALEGITFETDSDKIRSSSEANLAKAAEILAEFKSTRWLIEGHTDDVGDPEYNKELSERRAVAVKQWFVNKGISASRIETQGFGDTKPVQEGKTKAARAKNRRIEFKLLKDAPPTASP